MVPTRSSRVARLVLLLALAFATVLVGTSVRTGGATGAGLALPELPRNDAPVAVDGRAYAGAQVGNRIIVGGTFTLVEPEPGQTAIQQSHMYVYDVNSGLLDPNQFTVDDRVNVIIAAAEPNQVYIGGKFNTINGLTKRKLAKLDLATGQVIDTFTAQGNGAVTDLVLRDGKLYATGGFTEINADPAVGLAVVDPASGGVDAAFDIPLTTYIGQVSGSIGQRIAITPDGSTLVVMHRAKYVAGLERRGVAMVDLAAATPTVTDWRTSFWDPTSVVSIVDGEVSPDGTYLVVAGGWGDAPPWRDTAIAFPVAGGADVDSLWVSRNHDSTFAVGISDDAVFIGGHFCWTQGPDAPEPWAQQAPSGKCPNKTRRDDTNVYRDTLAALDPATGRSSVKWVPWTDARNGVRSIEVIPRGLLVGGDQERATDIRTGRSSLFDINDSPPMNLALAGVATQSSIAEDGSPDRAIDGNRDDQWFTQTITQTQDEGQPWWDLDLGGVFDVGSVELWNRGDCCDDRLTDVWVFLSEVPFVSNEPAVLAIDQNVESTFLTGVQAHKTVVAAGAQARYVRVQLDSSGILSLAEVRVFEGAGSDTVAPSSTVIFPVEQSVVVAPVDLNGDATDNVGVDQVIVEVRNRDTNDWLRSDGSWGGWMELDAVLDEPGATSTPWSLLIATLPDGRYKAFVRAVDAAGNSQVRAERKFDVGSVDLLLPTGGIDTPDADSVIPSPVAMAGWAQDNVAVDRVVVELRERDLQVWLRSDGSFGAWEALQAVLTQPGEPTSGWSYLSPAIPAGRYKMFVTVYDTAGNNTGQIVRKFEVG